MFDRIEEILPDVKKPARYAGGEYGAVIKERSEVGLRIAFCFPDVYEIGMSHIGLQILYGLLNSRPEIWCERVFAPWSDMGERLRDRGLPLCALESGDPLREFDIIAFTLQFELCYTQVLDMLDMAGLPVRSEDREGMPLIIAGGPCCYNPEPISAFIDLFVIGEGEDAVLELAELCKKAKTSGLGRDEIIAEASRLEGVYAPSLYEAAYNDDGTIAAITPKGGAPEVITKRIIDRLDDAYYPLTPVAPSTEVVHDRAALELFRGCIRGCRFCQAGFTNRPVRSRTPETLIKQAKAICGHGGYDEISLTSLSTSDYGGLEALTGGLLEWSEPRHINLSLPSLRADSFSPELMDKIKRVRKSGLTFAPEAGSARLRDVINKNITEEEILAACAAAFEGGWNAVKLYFMTGLPTETDEDILAISELCSRVRRTWRSSAASRARGVKISVSAACFVPKPHTPFQWEAQDSPGEFARKQAILRDSMGKGIALSWHDPAASLIEAVLARGDRRLCDVVESVWRSGAILEGWSEFFLLRRWLDALEAHNLDPAFYAGRVRGDDEVMPWSHISTGVPAGYLLRERRRAYGGLVTPDCRTCSNCGVSGLYKGEFCG